MLIHYIILPSATVPRLRLFSKFGSQNHAAAATEPKNNVIYFEDITAIKKSIRYVLRYTKVVIFRAVRSVRNCQLSPLLLKGAVACALWCLKVRCDCNLKMSI